MTASYAQSAVNPCGTDDIYQRMVKEHPEILIKDAQLKEEIATRMKEMDLGSLARTTDDDGTTVYHVPLVFHIIHDYGAEYVTDAEIQACVARINTMYNKMNADTASVLAQYKGFIPNSNKRYIGNARIVWHLATKDPLGNPTNGVTRRRNYITRNGGDFAKYDQWPSSNYMNIWLISKMSAANNSAAAYAYKPATGDVIPYYDGVIGLAEYVSEVYYTYSHELGHELNLDHPWGGTNNPKVACGDDEVEDTPPTKGHDPEGGCSDLVDLYDDSCLITYFLPVAKLRLDSIKRADSPVYSLAVMKDTSTSKGITFKCRTRTRIDSLSFYPSAALGSTYIIGLSKNGTLIDTQHVVTTAKDTAQKVACKFRLLTADTATNYKLFFLQNPGAWRDTSYTALRTFPKGLNGTFWLKNADDYQTGNYYNFFYGIKITYGFFKIYDNDSLVDYPDTTNAQNVMDYTYCSKMFTYGQTQRMRAAIVSSTAHRDSLITPYNTTVRTGCFDTPNLKPVAEFSVERAATSGGVQTSDRTYFMCKDDAASYLFRFQNRSWQATPTSVDWTFTNSASIGATTSSTGTVATKFAETGWATVTATATNANGSSTFSDRVYVADPATKDPIGYFQEFRDTTENKNWPIFNYYNNRYQWEWVNYNGYWDQYCIRYHSFDNRTALKDVIVGDPSGDYDDFFSPAFDLSNLGTNGNLNFMYAGAYATTNPAYMKDSMEIAYSTDCGGTWKTLYKMGGAKMQTVGTVPITTGEYFPVYNDWKPMSINLVSGTTKIRDTRVFFRFRYKPSSRVFAFTTTSGMYASGNNFYMDRINISNNPLSVNEMALGSKLASVAPNPTQSNAFVLFSKPNANVHVAVMDITGKLVYSIDQKIDNSNGRIEIPASAIAVKGMYMVHITGDNELNQTEKLVVY
ncbi:hypothetical protein GCM10023092_01650 [Rurimicrobium arvi]|uniref:T9SS type A sorting domain-containing protein n=2 Tax=Rurimicrobium arvi TaxID=2049916 RepID=A0ABP8MDB4_9BACT